LKGKSSTQRATSIKKRNNQGSRRERKKKRSSCKKHKGQISTPKDNPKFQQKATLAQSGETRPLDEAEMCVLRKNGERTEPKECKTGIGIASKKERKYRDEKGSHTS